MWRCYTEEKYGNSIRDAPDYTKKHEVQFYDCMFREATGLDVCMNKFSNMVRAIHRSGSSELNTNFWFEYIYLNKKTIYIKKKWLDFIMGN